MPKISLSTVADSCNRVLSRSVSDATADAPVTIRPETNVMANTKLFNFTFQLLGKRLHTL